MNKAKKEKPSKTSADCAALMIVHVLCRLINNVNSKMATINKKRSRKHSTYLHTSTVHKTAVETNVNALNLFNGNILNVFLLLSNP